MRSRLAQDFADWEAVVVDDASSEAAAVSAADVVRAIGDPRIQLIRHDRNLGVCAARNSGLRAARGEWLIFLDDDDEFVPGALKRMCDTAERAGTWIRRHVYMLLDDNGLINPAPPLTDLEVWDYRQYDEWIERVSERSDFCNCIHRDVFESVLWPCDRSREDLFHLELARRFRTQCHEHVVAIRHTDAPAQFTAVPGYGRLLRMAPDLSRQMIGILNEHGEALERWAPHKFARFLRHAAVNNFISGSRKSGLWYSARFLRRRPFAPSAWSVPPLGLIGKRPLALAVALQKRRIAARDLSRSADEKRRQTMPSNDRH